MASPSFLRPPCETFSKNEIKRLFLKPPQQRTEAFRDSRFFILLNYFFQKNRLCPLSWIPCLVRGRFPLSLLRVSVLFAFTFCLTRFRVNCFSLQLIFLFQRPPLVCEGFLTQVRRELSVWQPDSLPYPPLVGKLLTALGRPSAIFLSEVVLGHLVMSFQ